MAVTRGDQVLAEIAGDATRQHAERLPRDLNRVLDAAGVGLDEVELLAVGAGPGSFTGLRVGIAAVQGLASSRGLRVVPVSTLDALAAAAVRRGAAAGRLVAAWIDGQRGEVFAALYAAGDLVPLVAASAAPPRQTIERWQAAIGGRPVHFSGDGAVRYRDDIDDLLGDRAEVCAEVPLLAATIAGIAASDPARAVSPHAIAPIYVRRPDAELARERGALRR